MDQPAEVVYKVLYKNHCPYTNKCTRYSMPSKKESNQLTNIVCHKGSENYKECEFYKDFREK